MKRRAALFIAVLVMACACTDTASPDDPHQRLIGIYSAAIPAVVTHDRHDLDVEEAIDLVVFVAAREGVAVPIEVQIGVVNELEEWATIRFIDEFDEALMGEDEHRTVRDGGVLIQLGPVSEGTTSVSFEADRFEGINHLLAFEMSLLRRAGEWHVTEPVSATDVSLGT